MNFRGSGSPYSVVILQGVGAGSAHVKHPQMRIMSLCVSIAFLCMSVYMSVCPSLSLNIICGVVRAYQGSRARYWAFQVFCRNSKSVPFPINLAVIMVLNYALFIRNHYPPSPMSKSGPDFFLSFQCSGTCPTPAQGGILVSD